MGIELLGQLKNVMWILDGSHNKDTNLVAICELADIKVKGNPLIESDRFVLVSGLECTSATPL